MLYQRVAPVRDHAADGRPHRPRYRRTAQVHRRTASAGARVAAPCPFRRASPVRAVISTTARRTSPLACYRCGYPESRLLVELEGYDVRRCRSCDFVFSDFGSRQRTSCTTSTTSTRTSARTSPRASARSRTGRSGESSRSTSTSSRENPRPGRSSTSGARPVSSSTSRANCGVGRPRHRDLGARANRRAGAVRPYRRLLVRRVRTRLIRRGEHTMSSSIFTARVRTCGTCGPC